ncbi:MAG: hypothetical protein ACI8RD_010232, partial [Bacillariaceae sp.]
TKRNKKTSTDCTLLELQQSRTNFKSYRKVLNFSTVIKQRKRIVDINFRDKAKFLAITTSS